MKAFTAKNKDFEELKNNTVMTNYNGKFYRIDSITDEIKANSTFKDKKDNEKSYVSYYKEKYGITIKDESQPLIKVIEKRGRAKIEETFYLIPELCCMTGLTDNMRADFNMMKKLAEATKPKAFERINQAKDFIERVSKDGQNLVKAWDIDIVPTPKTCDFKTINAGSMIMEEGKKNIDIARSNLDRDTQVKMYEQAPLT